MQSGNAQRRNTVVTISTGIVLVTAALLAGCDSGKAAAPASQPPEVAVVTVQRAAVPVTTELPGRTSAFLVAQVRARVDGIVLKRAFKEGGAVRANQLLYQIDAAPYRAALDSAAATLVALRVSDLWRPPLPMSHSAGQWTELRDSRSAQCNRNR